MQCLASLDTGAAHPKTSIRGSPICGDAIYKGFTLTTHNLQRFPQTREVHTLQEVKHLRAGNILKGSPEYFDRCHANGWWCRNLVAATPYAGLRCKDEKHVNYFTLFFVQACGQYALKLKAR